MISKKHKDSHKECSKPQSDSAASSLWLPMIMMFFLKPWDYGEQDSIDECTTK